MQCFNNEKLNDLYLKLTYKINKDQKHLTEIEK